MVTRVLIVDDHELFRSRAKKFLESSGYAVVGEAGSAQQALEEARRLTPDVVLLDVQLPDGDGFSVAKILEAQPSPPTIVLVSSREASDYGSRLEQVRAGFIYKPDICRMTLQAIIDRVS